MSDQSYRKKAGLANVAIAATLLASCSSVPTRSLVSAPPMCSGKSPTQKYVWTTSFYQGIPKGMELARVSELVKVRSELQDRIADYNVAAFLYLSSNSGQFSKYSSRTKNQGLSRHAEYLADERSASLIETGNSNFTSCIWDECAGLKDPVTGAIIKSANDNGRYSNMRLRKMYYVEGIIDTNDMKFDKHRQSSNSSPSPAYVEWGEYFERHPFPAGDFLADNYFVVPDSAKKSLCAKAGFEADCFGPPRYDFHNELIVPNKCDIQDMGCNLAFALMAPYRYQFLLDNKGMCGNSCMSDINSLLKGLKEDPFLKRKWEDAIAKDIFLRLSISKTRKVEKNWIVTRTEFNPTLFCQYARPNSELLSQ